MVTQMVEKRVSKGHPRSRANGAGLQRPSDFWDRVSVQIGECTVNVKYSTRGAYIEYDILNFNMHNSTSTQSVLKVSSLKILSN